MTSPCYDDGEPIAGQFPVEPWNDADYDESNSGDPLINQNFKVLQNRSGLLHKSVSLDSSLARRANKKTRGGQRRRVRSLAEDKDDRADDPPMDDIFYAKQPLDQCSMKLDFDDDVRKLSPDSEVINSGNIEEEKEELVFEIGAGASDVADDLASAGTENRQSSPTDSSKTQKSSHARSKSDVVNNDGLFKMLSSDEPDGVSLSSSLPTSLPVKERHHSLLEEGNVFIFLCSLIYCISPHSCFEQIYLSWTLPVHLEMC